ncbi:DUF177 domain-containing protein [Chloroflexota bacterium]
MYKKEATPAAYELQFNVAQLLKEATGATRSYDVNADIENELDKDVIKDAIIIDDGVIAVSPLAGQVEFLRAGLSILVTGQLKTTIQKTCTRCLTNFTTPVPIELEEEFYPVIDMVTGNPVSIPEDADPANIIDEQSILDLVEVVRQELVVATDAVLYCRPNCQGLCPRCGQDRNVNPCDCQDNQIDPRWADLQTLQTDD